MEQLLIDNGFEPETIALDEAQMIYKLLTNGLSVFRVQGAYSASGNAIRMDRAFVATQGYESAPSDFICFQLEN